MNTTEFLAFCEQNAEKCVPAGTLDLPRLVLTKHFEPAIQLYIRNTSGRFSHLVVLSPNGIPLSSQMLLQAEVDFLSPIRKCDFSDPMVKLYLTLLCRSLPNPSVEELHSLEILWYRLVSCDLRKLWEDGDIDAQPSPF